MKKTYTVLMNNLIISNAAGTFSSILKYLAWMSVQDENKETINVYFDFQNKTHNSGNSLLNYGSKKYSEITPIINQNIFNVFFKNEIVENYPENSIFVEKYPYEMKDLILNYPNYLLKYEGRGCDILQYFDSLELNKIRKNLNNQWKKINLSENLLDRLKIETENLFNKNEKILCVMVRYSDHYVGDFSYQDIISEIKLEMINYDKLLIISQITPLINNLKDIFKERCLYFENRHRVDNYDTDWHGGRGIRMSDKDFIKETEDCMIDVIAASKCSIVLGGASNMMLGSLLINPDIDYKIFKVLHNKIGR